MIGVQELSRLSTAMFAAALDPRQWDTVLGMMSERFPGVATHILAHDIGNDRQTGFYAHGYDPKYLESYSEHYAERNPWAATFAVHDVGAVLPSSRMCPDEALERTEFYHDWLRPQDDIMGGGGTVLDKSAGSAFLLGGNIRRRDREAVEPEWLAFMALVGPMMRHAWAINLRLASGALERHALAGRAGSEAAILVVGADGGVAFANAAAEAMLAGGGIIETSAIGRLRFAAPDHDARLRRTGLGHAVGDAFEVSDGPRAWDVRLSRFDPDALGDWGPSRLLRLEAPSTLVVITPRSGGASSIPGFAASAGLTQAEAEVALALAEGLSPREIAERRGTSIHTVRTQIKSAMAACGVRRQSQLAALALRHMQ